jgi:hypothetical protein
MERTVLHTLATALLLTLTSLLPTRSGAQELTYYLETFHRCESSAGRDAAESARWTARAGGEQLGRPGYLKVFQPGKPVPELPVNAQPMGSEEGHAFWSKPVNGLSIYTEEVRIGSNDLVKVEFHQRTDGRSSEKRHDAVQLLLRVGPTWYISDQRVEQITRSRWESVTFPLAEMTFGIATIRAQHSGPLPPTPDATGIELPEGEISAVGVFYAKTHGRVRIDNFRIVSRTTAGATQTPHEESCAPSTPSASFCPLPVQRGRRLFTPDLKVAGKLVRSIKEGSAIGARDRALLGLLTYGKLRTGELVNVRRSDFGTLGKTAFLQPEGGSHRLIGRRAAKLLEQYFATTSSHTEDDPIFAGLAEQTPLRALCSSEIQAMVKRRIAQSGLRGVVRLVR